MNHFLIADCFSSPSSRLQMCSTLVFKSAFVYMSVLVFPITQSMTSANSRTLHQLRKSSRAYVLEIHTLDNVLGVVLLELSFAKHILSQMMSTELLHRSTSLITSSLAIHSYSGSWEFQFTLSE